MWGIPMPPCGPRLLGVFHPSSRRITATAAAQSGAIATALAGAEIDGVKMGMQQLLGATNMMNLGGVMGDMPRNGMDAGGAGSNLTSGRRIWTGNLHVQRERNDQVAR